MKKPIAALILLIPTILTAQSIDRQVTGSAGAYSANDSASLSWTLGETSVEGYTKSTGSLSQGFQQGSIEVTTLVNNNRSNYSFKVYPNPVINHLTVETNEETFKFSVLDINGKIVIKSKLSGNPKIIDLSSLPPGQYILKSRKDQTHKIIKQ